MSMGVVKGDQVYVLGQGAGVVRRVAPDGSFDVTVAGRGETHYTADGCLGLSQMKKVFWADPLIVEPDRNQLFWEAYVRLAKALHDEMLTLQIQGVI